MMSMCDKDSLWIDRMMDLAHHVATWSRAPVGRRHGCVLALDGRYVVATGYNGPYSGAPDSMQCSRCEGLPKAWCVSQCCAIHGEVNAVASLARAGVRTHGADIDAYCTKQPCMPCFGTLVNAGVSMLFTREPAKWELPARLMPFKYGRRRDVFAWDLDRL